MQPANCRQSFSHHPVQLPALSFSHSTSLTPSPPGRAEVTVFQSRQTVCVSRAPGHVLPPPPQHTRSTPTPRLRRRVQCRGANSRTNLIQTESRSRPGPTKTHWNNIGDTTVLFSLPGICGCSTKTYASEPLADPGGQPGRGTSCLLPPKALKKFLFLIFIFCRK